MTERSTPTPSSFAPGLPPWSTPRAPATDVRGRPDDGPTRSVGDRRRPATIGGNYDDDPNRAGRTVTRYEVHRSSERDANDSRLNDEASDDNEIDETHAYDERYST
jgi:hypothetical protein